MPGSVDGFRSDDWRLDPFPVARNPQPAAPRRTPAPIDPAVSRPRPHPTPSRPHEPAAMPAPVTGDPNVSVNSRRRSNHNHPRSGRPDSDDNPGVRLTLCGQKQRTGKQRSSQQTMHRFHCQSSSDSAVDLHFLLPSARSFCNRCATLPATGCEFLEPLQQARRTPYQSGG